MSGNKSIFCVCVDKHGSCAVAGCARLGLDRHRADDVPTVELSQSRRIRTRYKYGLNYKLKTPFRLSPSNLENSVNKDI